MARSYHHEKKRNSDISAVAERTRRLQPWLQQSGSTIFLAAAVATFPREVDSVYFVGCCCNFFVSVMYHGWQRPVIPESKHRVIFWGYEWPCSGIREDVWLGWTLKRLDQAFVCFICFYTGACGCQQHSNHAWSAWSAFAVSLAAGFVGMPVNGVLLGWALYLTISSGKLSDLAVNYQMLFCFAAVLGPICFGYMCRIGAWCLPHRYFWHFCCGCLVGVGGLLNTHPKTHL